MLKRIPLPSQERLKELYVYSPDTGSFYKKTHIYKPKARPATRAGKLRKPAYKRRKIGSLNPVGYLRTKVDGKFYMLHRLIWRWMTGEDPGSLTIDHIDENKSNNKWENLRLATQSQNTSWSQKTIGSIKPTDNGRFEAKIGSRENHIWLGTFDCYDQAQAACIQKAEEIRPGFVPYHCLA